MTIQEILRELDVEYLEAGHHHCRIGWIQIKDCPFCSSQNYHLGWNLAINWVSCWRCGGHSAWNTLEALGLSRQKIHSILPGIRASETPIKRERSRISVQEPAGIGPFQPSHARYLRSRGFDPGVIERLWQVAGIGLAAHLAWRLYIPIIHHQIKVSWTTRAIGERVAQRYISAQSNESLANIKDCIYGGDYCTHTIVICEGPVDAWKIGPGAGALFGTSFTIAQVKKLIKIPRRFICFDSSPEAQRKAQDLAEQLSCFSGLTENLVIDSKDPGEASEKELKLIRKVAGL